MTILEDQSVSDRYISSRCFKPSFIKQVVQQVEDGLDFQEAYKLYGLGSGTLRSWLRKYASSAYVNNKQKRLSAQVKTSVCRAIRNGKMTANEAASAYQVHVSTVHFWRKKEKHELEASNTLLLKKPKETSAVTLPIDDIKALQEQLAYANLKIAALNTLIDVAEEQLKINIRKKPGAKQS